MSPSGGTLACFNFAGTVCVFSSDFQNTLTQFATKSKLVPLNLVWCGDDSVVLYWGEFLNATIGHHLSHRPDQRHLIVSLWSLLRMPSHFDCHDPLTLIIAPMSTHVNRRSTSWTLFIHATRRSTSWILFTHALHRSPEPVDANHSRHRSPVDTIYSRNHLCHRVDTIHSPCHRCHHIDTIH